MSLFARTWAAVEGSVLYAYDYYSIVDGGIPLPRALAGLGFFLLGALILILLVSYRYCCKRVSGRNGSFGERLPLTRNQARFCQAVLEAFGRCGAAVLVSFIVLCLVVAYIVSVNASVEYTAAVQELILEYQAQLADSRATGVTPTAAQLRQERRHIAGLVFASSRT